MDGKTSSQYVGCTSSTYTLSYCSTSADCSSGCVNMEVPFSADCDAYGNKYFCSSDEASYNNFDELNQYTE